jgi:hypothetical protein
MEPIYQGWTRPVKSICIRCEKEMDNSIYLLCDECHRHDDLESSFRNLWDAYLESQDDAYTRTINDPRGQI